MTINGQKCKVVFRKGKPLTKIVLMITIILCTVALIVIYNSITTQQNRLAASRQQAISEEREKQEIQEDIDQLGSHESVIDIAGEHLGLYDPDTIIVEKAE
ncbi:MAG: hypothetical protein IJB11_03385 [Oscillospiraceae bacterium]|nr:hypothetical protein [Oscillospiraceae bacterium]